MFSVIVLAALAGILNAAHPTFGTFALQAGDRKSSGHLVSAPLDASKRNERIDFWLTDERGATITRYRIDMTKYVHLIVISDDFESFAHVHPTLTPDGHFHIDHRFPRDGTYHVYADCEPEALGQQVFRFDLALGRAAAASSRDAAPTGTSADVDGYRVTLDRVSLKANADTKIAVHITKNGRLATDLHPYLGALAHAVFIDAGDLSYLHVHPAALGAAAMNMSGDMAGMHMDDAPLSDTAKSSAEMQLDAHVVRPGIYKLWLQFRGGGLLHVAPFVVNAAA